MEWYYILGAVSYGIFIVQFLLSIIGGDTDIDIDFDGDTDFDVSDLLSFKGLIHFAMGFSGWLMIAQSTTVSALVIASIVGLVFVIVLYFMYKMCMKFSYEPSFPEGSNLIGKQVVVYITQSDNNCICYLKDNVTKEINCISTTPIQKVGEIKTINSFKSGIYYIS